MFEWFIGVFEEWGTLSKIEHKYEYLKCKMNYDCVVDKGLA